MHLYQCQAHLQKKHAENPFSSEEVGENLTSHTPASVTTTLIEERESSTPQDIGLYVSSRPARNRKPPSYFKDYVKN